MSQHFWTHIPGSQGVARLANERDVLIAASFCVLFGWLGDRLAAGSDGAFTWSATGGYAVLLVCLRVAAGLAARALGRPAIAATLATRLMLGSGAVLFIVNAAGAAHWAIELGFDIDPDFGLGLFPWIAIVAVAMPLWIAGRGFARDVHALRRLFALWLVPGLAFVLVSQSDAWSSFYYQEEPEEIDASIFDTAMTPVQIEFDPEDLLAIQDRLLDEHLAALKPQRPGQIDWYLLSMAGDASIDVFRNEAELVTTRFDAGFDTRGRSLRLINHPDTLTEVPMATRRNLLRALEGIGRIIDPAEDIVVVYMTSHGSKEHDWLVQLGDFSLTQIGPEDLDDGFDQAGIRWRIALVSACYSGGYIDLLSASTSLVLTSARSDRTSFGCSADADLTFFGRALVAEALAENDDLVAAFELAKTRIAEREQKEDFEPSEPQLRLGEAMATHLAKWRSSRGRIRP